MTRKDHAFLGSARVSRVGHSVLAMADFSCASKFRTRCEMFGKFVSARAPKVGVEEGVGVGVGVGPLYSSALAETLGKFSPPAASTIPLDSEVAVCRPRAAL